MLTRETLHRLWPRAPRAKIDAILEIAPEVLPAYGITSAMRLAHFMAQVSVENNAGTASRENMNYSADGLLRIFGVGKHSAKVTPAEAVALARKPELIAERVYGLGNPKKAKELGNLNPGDGWKYRGGGDLQITGGHNYKHVGKITGFPVYEHPELLEDYATSFRVAAAEFQALNCLPAADADKCELVTKRVNGGANGLAERKAWLQKWKIALPQLPEREPAHDEPEGEPRGAESAPAPPLSESTIVKGAATIGTSVAAPAAGAIIKATTDEPDAPTKVETVTAIVDRAGGVIDTVTTVTDKVPVPKGFMASVGSFLTDPIVVAVFLAIALAGVGYVVWRRHVMRQEEGV